MNAMTHIAHPELIARPFAAWPAQIPLPQDEIRKAMTDATPKHMRPGPAQGQAARYGVRANPYEQRRLERERMAPAVMRMRERNMTPMRIARELGVSEGTIRRIIAETAISQEHIEAIAPAVMDMARAGQPLMVIAAKFGTGADRIRRIIAEYTPPGETILTGYARFAAIREQARDEVMRLTREGVRQKDIAARVGLGRNVVSRIVKEAKG